MRSRISEYSSKTSALSTSPSQPPEHELCVIIVPFIWNLLVIREWIT